MVTQRSNWIEDPTPETAPPLVGAPLIERFAPLAGTAPARFAAWLPDNAARITRYLEALTTRWDLVGAFVVVRFIHPTRGPAGAVAVSTTTLDTGALRHRLRRLTVIPLTDLTPFVPRWERGETTLVEVVDMPSELGRRYAATPVRWSLNVPVMSDGTWVGVVGAVNGADGVDPGAVRSFEALTAWLTREFEADTAWTEFMAATSTPRVEGEGDSGNRLLRLLR